MSTIISLVDLLLRCPEEMASRTPTVFQGCLVLALLLAGTTFWGCMRSIRLWNQTYPIPWWSYLAATFASLVIFSGTILLPSSGLIKDAAVSLIEDWSKHLPHDRRWTDETFKEAKRQVVKLGLEEPASYQKETIPVSHEESRKAAARTYAQAAVAHFREHNPLLSKLLSPKANPTEQEIYEDVRVFFEKNPGKKYGVEQAIDLASENLRQDLQRQAPKVVVYARALVTMGVLVLIAIPFGLVGMNAYRDIRIHQ